MKKFTRKNTKTIKDSAYGLFWNGDAYECWLYSCATGSKLKRILKDRVWKTWEKDLALEFVEFVYKYDSDSI